MKQLIKIAAVLLLSACSVSPQSSQSPQKSQPPTEVQVPESRVVAGGGSTNTSSKVTAQLDLAYRTYAAILNTTADLVRANAIDVSTANHVLQIAEKIRPLLDTSAKQLGTNQLATAQENIDLSNKLLSTMQQSIQKRSPK